MIEFIAKYWLEAAFAALSAAFAAMYRRVKSYIKRVDAMDDAIIALLHDRLYSLCTEYIDRGSIDYDELRNLGYIYQAYTKLGGNGTGAELYRRAKSLPIKDKEETKK